MFSLSAVETMQIMYSFLSACKGSKNFVTSYNTKQSFMGYNAVSRTESNKRMMKSRLESEKAPAC